MAAAASYTFPRPDAYGYARGPAATARPPFPELASAPEQLGQHDAVLDGELVCLDATGTPDFERVRRRLGLRRATAIATAAARQPAAFVAFDLLALDEQDLCPLPYRERRALLEHLVGATGAVCVVRSYDAGRDDLLAATRTLQLEGVVAKRLESRYFPGRRSHSWLKHKHWRSEDLLVTGWRPASRREPDTVFLARIALDGTLTYAGQAAYGLDRQRAALHRALEAHTRPSKNRNGIRSVRPTIGIRVEHHGRAGFGPLRDAVMRTFTDLATQR
jgi:bifunctional non-homologous end joining protein LigD